MVFGTFIGKTVFQTTLQPVKDSLFVVYQPATLIRLIALWLKCIIPSVNRPTSLHRYTTMAFGHKVS